MKKKILVFCVTVVGFVSCSQKHLGFRTKGDVESVSEKIGFKVICLSNASGSKPKNGGRNFNVLYCGDSFYVAPGNINGMDTLDYLDQEVSIKIVSVRFTSATYDLSWVNRVEARDTTLVFTSWTPGCTPEKVVWNFSKTLATREDYFKNGEVVKNQIFP